jgi:hypothetical protein
MLLLIYLSINNDQLPVWSALSCFLTVVLLLFHIRSVSYVQLVCYWFILANRLSIKCLFLLDYLSLSFASSRQAVLIYQGFLVFYVILILANYWYIDLATTTMVLLVIYQSVEVGGS